MGDGGGFANPSGSGDPPDHRSAVPHRRNRRAIDISSPSHGNGHYSGTVPRLNSAPPFAVTDDARQQVYRMYHIYNRNVWVCIVPSIVIFALLGEFVFPLVFPVRLPSPLQLQSHSRWLWSGVPTSGAHIQRKSSAKLVYGFLLPHTIASPYDPVNVLETTLTGNFLDSVIALARRVSGVAVPPIRQSIDS